MMRLLKSVVKNWIDWLVEHIFDTVLFDSLVAIGWVFLGGLYMLKFVSVRAFFLWVLLCFWAVLFTLGFVLRYRVVKR